MSAELRRLGIDPTQGVWFFTLQGDPSVSGFQAGVGSIATQVDSSPPGVVFYKVGPNPTDWNPLFFDGTRRVISVLDLPDISSPVQRRVMDLLTNPVLADQALKDTLDLRDGTIDDVKFAFAAGPNW